MPSTTPIPEQPAFAVVASRASLRRAWPLWLFCFVWTLPGLFGRDPWKADEAYSFGMVFNILDNHEWLVPSVAGEPFMEKPPIMYLVGALCAQLFGGLLPLHDAARGAVVFFNLLTFIALGWASRELNGPGRGWLAPLLLMGAIGLLHNQHMLITDVALLTGFAFGHGGLALSLRRPWLGGAVAGTGLGLAFLAKGLLGPGLLGLTALLLPLVGRPWRTRNWCSSMLGLGMAALPWIVIWPWLIYQRSPQLFHDWFWVNNIGRFAGGNAIGPENQPLFYFTLLPWFALPALPLAAWAWWRERTEWRTSAAWQLTLLSFVVMLGVLTFAADGRSLYAQPMLVPLALAGARAVDWLDGAVARWGTRLCLALVVVVDTAAWLGWLVLLLGPPAAWRARLREAVPHFQPAFEWWPFLFALTASVAVAIWWLRSNRSAGRHAVVWFVVVLIHAYTLAMTLFLALLDANMTYRHTFTELRAVLPPKWNCVASVGLSSTHRGLLHYFAGVQSRRAEANERALDDCDLVLMLGNYRKNERMGPPERGPWEKIWEGRRGGRESFRLYRRR